MRIKDEIFCFARLRWCHNGWASNILIVVDTGYTGYAGIHHSKYWMPIHYDTIEDGQNKKSHLLFSNSRRAIHILGSWFCYPCLRHVPVLIGYFALGQLELKYATFYWQNVLFRSEKSYILLKKGFRELDLYLKCGLKNWFMPQLGVLEIAGEVFKGGLIGPHIHKPSSHVGAPGNPPPKKILSWLWTWVYPADFLYWYWHWLLTMTL